MNRDEIKNFLRTGKIADIDDDMRRELEIYHRDIEAENKARRLVNGWLELMSPMTHWTDYIENLVGRIAEALKEGKE